MSGRALSESFDRHPKEVARARRVIRAALHAWHLGREAPTLELIVSELVSNALVHGGGAITVRLWSEGGRLGLEVADDGRRPRTIPAVRAGDGAGDAVGGWGLRLVEELSDDWGVRLDDGRTVVWMVRRTAGRDGTTFRRPHGARRAARVAAHGPPGDGSRHHR